MDTHSLDVPKRDLDTISGLFRDALTAASSFDLLGSVELAHRARSSDEFKALLNAADAAFQKGRKQHIDLDFPGAIAAYRDAISTYERAAAGIYLPQPLSEAHLQLGISLAQSSRLSDAMAELRHVITLTPWRDLDPSVYNPTVRKLFVKKRKEMKRLPDIPADAVVLHALERLSKARLLVRPIVDATSDNLVLHAAVIDLRKGKIIGVESAVMDRSLRNASQCLGKLSKKLQPLLGVPSPEPVQPAPEKLNPTIALAAGGNLGFGIYPRLGASAFSAHFELPLHRRIRISMGAGLRLDFASQVTVPETPPTFSPPDDWRADLTFWDIPIEVASQIILFPGDFEIYLELGFVFDLLYLEADNAASNCPEVVDLRIIKTDTFGFGPGFKAGAGLRWRISASCSLIVSASYHFSMLFYKEDFHIHVTVPNKDPPPPMSELDFFPQPRDILQGIELSFGIALDL